MNHQLSPAAQARDWTFSKTPAAVPAAARLVPAGLRTNPLHAPRRGRRQRLHPQPPLPGRPRPATQIWAEIGPRGYTRRSLRLFPEHEQVVICHEPEAGLRALIAVHDTTLGPALGGIRMWTYDSDEAALTDVLRLSRGMTYKNSAAGLAARRRQDGRHRRSAHAEERAPVPGAGAVHRVARRPLPGGGGRRHVDRRRRDRRARDAPHHRPAGREGRLRGPLADDGVGRRLRHAGRDRGGRSRRRASTGVRVAVQGAGHVGGGVVRHLLEAGARVTVADLYPDRIEPLVALGAEARRPPDGALAGVRRLLAVRARRRDPARDGGRAALPRRRRRGQQPAPGRLDGRRAPQPRDPVRARLRDQRRRRDQHRRGARPAVRRGPRADERRADRRHAPHRVRASRRPTACRPTSRPTGWPRSGSPPPGRPTPIRCRAFARPG